MIWWLLFKLIVLFTWPLFTWITFPREIDFWLHFFFDVYRKLVVMMYVDYGTLLNRKITLKIMCFSLCGQSIKFVRLRTKLKWMFGLLISFETKEKQGKFAVSIFFFVLNWGTALRNSSYPWLLFMLAYYASKKINWCTTTISLSQIRESANTLSAIS